MTSHPSTNLRAYCLRDVAASLALLGDLPEVSGAITKSYDFKVRVNLPLNRHTEQLLAARTGSLEQRVFLRELMSGGQLTTGSVALTVVCLTLREDACRIFRRELGVVVLLQFQLSYSAHRAYSGREMRGALNWRTVHPRDGVAELNADMLGNS